MKRLMVAVAAVAIACGVNAASFSWDNGNYGLQAYDQPGDDGASYSGTIYLMKVAGGTGNAAAKSMIESILAAGAGWEASFDAYAADKFRSIDITGYGQTKDAWTASVSDGNYDFFEIAKDATSKGIWVSEISSKPVSESVGKTELYFSEAASYDNHAFADTVKTYQGSGWYTAAVPEPTSGLLLLLGVAGLALRRRRA